MTKQLSDLFESFSQMETSKQLEKIREIRHHRSIERPAAAVKRVKKEVKKRKEKANKALELFKSLTPEQQKAILESMNKGSKS